jgi:hypothetical protein
MLRSKRAYWLVAAGLVLTGAASAPAGAPAASEPISSTVDMAALQMNAPSEAVLTASNYAVMLTPELPDNAAPVSTEDGMERPLDLPHLVDAVAQMNAVELSPDLRCLASAIYNEARGESLEGQLAVAQVVLNRAASDRWPDRLCDVVYQSGQFSFTFDGRPDYPADNEEWRRSKAIAIIAVTRNWKDVTDSALFFHATYVDPTWNRKFEKTRRIGQHIFYR